MRYLLDTHVLLWTLFDDSLLTKNVQTVIKNPDNGIFASVISYWEISLKFALGKLELEGVEPDELPGYAERIGMECLNISEKLVSTFYQLPKTENKDPFDRLIIWQTIQENMTLISKDAEMEGYKKFGLKMFWE
jgi:PIN domain nuclease of toxin-antitoxin system